MRIRSCSGNKLDCCEVVVLSGGNVRGGGCER